MSRFNRAEQVVREAIDQARADMRNLRYGGHDNEAEHAHRSIQEGYEIIHLIKRIQADERHRTKVLIEQRKVKPYSTPRDQL